MTRAGNGSGAGLRMRGNAFGITLGEVTAALAVALVTLAYSLGFGLLLFPEGTPAAQTAAGLGVSMALIGALVAGLMMGLFSSFRSLVAAPDSPVVAVLGAMSVKLTTVAAIGAELHVAAVTVGIAVAGIVAGLLLISSGTLRLGRLLKFIPYPVIGGFLIASALLLVEGGLMIAAPEAGLLDVPGLITRDPVLVTSLVCAALFCVTLVFRTTSWLMPTLILSLTAAAIWGALSLTGSFADARADGWLLDFTGALPLPDTLGALSTLREADIYGVSALVLGELITVCLVTVMLIVLHTGSLEILHSTRADLNREMGVAGAVNVISGVLGAMPSNHSYNRTVLLSKGGGQTRTAPILAVVLLGVVFILGGHVIGFVPRPVVAGLMIFVGLSVFAGVVRDAMRASAFTVVFAVAIAAVSLGFGYLAGVATGIVAACLQFAVANARAGVVRVSLSRKEITSRTDWPSDAGAYLRDQGERIRVLRLQGYLFFGTASRLFEEIDACLDAMPSERPATLILNFRMVTGLDVSARIGLARIVSRCREAGVTLTITEARPDVRYALPERTGADGTLGYHLVPQEAEALHQAEKTLLAAEPSLSARGDDFTQWLERELASSLGVSQAEGPRLAKALLDVMERSEMPGGAVVCRQGEPADSVDFVAKGSVGVYLEQTLGAPDLLLRTMRDRTVVGEIGFFRRTARSATVRAEEPAVIYRLNREGYQRLVDQGGGAGRALHLFVIRVLAERLMLANAAVAGFERGDHT